MDNSRTIQEAIALKSRRIKNAGGDGVIRNGKVPETEIAQYLDHAGGDRDIAEQLALQELEGHPCGCPETHRGSK